MPYVSLMARYWSVEHTLLTAGIFANYRSGHIASYISVFLGIQKSRDLSTSAKNIDTCRFRQKSSSAETVTP